MAATAESPPLITEWEGFKGKTISEVNLRHSRKIFGLEVELIFSDGSRALIQSSDPYDGPLLMDEELPE